MEYIFVLGRNFELSLAELLCFFKRKSIDFKFVDFLKDMNLVIFDINSKFEPKYAMKFLGGTIKIAKILIRENGMKQLKEKIKNIFLWEGKENKINYAVTSDEKTIEILGDIQNNLKNDKLRAFKVSFGKENPSKAKKIDLDLFSFYSEYEKKYFLARIEAVYDTTLAEKVDMQKPVRRQELAISPRLAKILINLSEVKEDGVLMDPFCGIGSILIESLMQKQKFIGMDINEDSIKGAKRNLDWIKKEFNINFYSYTLKVQNTIFMEIFADAAATEPNLGPLNKKNFSPKEAEAIKKRLENFYHAIFFKLRKYIKGKIAITMPRLILNQGKHVSLDVVKLCEQTAMRICNPLQDANFENFEMPFVDQREKQHVVREIWILEKGEKLD